MTRVFLLLVVWLTSLCASAHATGLYGKVIEVNDGDTITIFNLNKPVIVRLIGVAAPNQKQPFGDVAKQHLSDLILYRSVSVEYQGFVQNNYLLGTVLYKDMDIGAQMIRDGVAWFDPQTSSRMSEPDKQVYADCERAARAEHRGLWQDSAPVAPWNFKEKVADTAANSTASSQSSSNPKPKVLSSEELVSGVSGSSRSTGSSSVASIAGETEWRRLAPNNHFSVMVPGTGNETLVELPAGTGVVKANIWTGEYDGVSYMVLWARGENYAYEDSAALEDMARGLMTGITRGYEARGVKVPWESIQPKNLKVGTVSGLQYDLTSAGVPFVTRIFSRRVGDDREMYLLSVYNAPRKSALTDRFLTSLSFGSKK
jgi:endonuclease YncB( thermonuclease family)